MLRSAPSRWPDPAGGRPDPERLGTESPAISPGLLSRLYLPVFSALLLWRLFLAWRFPFLGDEAYFLLWGRHPALGYYDHPPMLGWWLAPLVQLSESPFLARLPTVIGIALMGWILYRAARPVVGEEMASGASLLLLLSPFYVVDVFVLTDTPLMLFTLGSGILYWRATVRDSLPLYAGAGVMLGLAILSKYLAGLLALAYLLRVLLVSRSSRQTRGLLVLGVAAAPFLLFNLWWNAENCWPNLFFNLVSRHVGEAERYTWKNVLICGATHLWFLSPVGLVLVSRRWRRIRRAARDRLWSPPVFAALVPLALLTISSFFGPFGAYWVLSFYPFLYLLFARVLEPSEMRLLVSSMAVFAVAHVALFTWAVTRPLETWEERSFYDALVMMERPAELAERVESRAEGRPLAALGYSPASLLAWGTGGPVAVFGPGSHYARQDDYWTDWSRYRDGSLAIFSKEPPARESLIPYFESTRIVDLSLAGAEYHLVLGDGFRYRRYRDEVLEEIRRRYYPVPAWLPDSGCPVPPAEDSSACSRPFFACSFGARIRAVP